VKVLNLGFPDLRRMHSFTFVNDDHSPVSKDTSSIAMRRDWWPLIQYAIEILAETTN